MKRKNEFWVEKRVYGVNLLMEQISYQDSGQKQQQLLNDYGVQEM